MYEIAGKLQELANKHGDFKVARAYKKANGDIIWTKHQSVMKLWETENGIWLLNQSNNREILPTEIVLDLDKNPTKEKMNDICNKLEEINVKYKSYHTGSKGYHIHIYDKELINYPKKFKKTFLKWILKFTEADLMKANEYSMIAIEEVPHWKTGKIKKVVRTNIK